MTPGTSPPSKLSSRFLPTASTPSSRPAVQLFGYPGGGCPRVRALDLDCLPHQHLETTRGAMKRVTLGHAWDCGRARPSPAAAGAVAASVWSLLEPIDRRLLRCDYSDVLLLGMTFTRGRLAWPVGFAIHAANGALFGLAFDRVRQRVPYSKEQVAIGMALAEHVALYPLSYFVDRYPARGQAGIPPLFTNTRLRAGDDSARRLRRC